MLWSSAADTIVFIGSTFKTSVFFNRSLVMSDVYHVSLAFELACVLFRMSPRVTQLGVEIMLVCYHGF